MFSAMPTQAVSTRSRIVGIILIPSVEFSLRLRERTRREITCNRQPSVPLPTLLAVPVLPSLFAIRLIKDTSEPYLSNEINK